MDVKLELQNRLIKMAPNMNMLFLDLYFWFFYYFKIEIVSPFISLSAYLLFNYRLKSKYFIVSRFYCCLAIIIVQHTSHLRGIQLINHFFL